MHTAGQSTLGFSTALLEVLQQASLRIESVNSSMAESLSQRTTAVSTSQAQTFTEKLTVPVAKTHHVMLHQESPP